MYLNVKVNTSTQHMLCGCKYDNCKIITITQEHQLCLRQQQLPDTYRYLASVQLETG